MKFTNEDLREMQAWDLDRKISMAKTQIIKFVENERGGVQIKMSTLA